MKILPLLFACMLSVCACTEVEVLPSPAAPDDPNPSVTIEFRVFGNARSAIVRFGNPVDGLTVLKTSLPYVAIITTIDPFIFLSLEATPTSFADSVAAPFMSAQIFVNGRLFREATSSEPDIHTLSVSGTWRQ